MAEPEELIIDGAHRATRLARAAWRRYGPPDAERVVPLGAVRARLELFVTALLGVDIVITASEPPAPPTWLGRLAHPTARHLRHRRLEAGTDGSGIRLPPALPNLTGEAEAIALYRLLAVEQAARVVRGTARRLSRIRDAEARDRFLVEEGAAIDRWILRQTPGLAPVLGAARADALAARPPARVLTERERAVEDVLCAALRGAFDAMPPGSAPIAERSPDRTTARTGAAGRYRGLAPVFHWGVVLPPPIPVRGSGFDGPDAAAAERPQSSRVAEMPRRPRPRDAAADEDDEGAGTWVIRADEPLESVEDPFGLQRPADRDDDADPDGLGDSLSELPESRVVRTPGRPREVLRSEDRIARAEGAAPRAGRVANLAYPEWDCRAMHYRVPGAIVRTPPPPLGDSAWPVRVLSRQGRLVRRVRTRFERLKARHVRVGRQLDGTELDLDAWVTAMTDFRAGAGVDGRLYSELRRVRRELTVALLVDVSASTDAWVSGTHRIVDVEKEALLVVCEALDALGDPYGIFAFSGEGPEDVSVLALKAFEERNDATVRRRIAALEADRYTRIGAPIRHVTAALCRQPTRRRLLLILSDGKPNDVDVYEGRYGVEDARQAVAEARRQGVTVFCLTVDREAPRYASRVFGPSGFSVLRRADQLPMVLIDALRQLIRT